MLGRECKAADCSDEVVMERGRKMGAADSEGVDGLESKPREAGEGETVVGVVVVESVVVDKDE